MRGEVAGQLRRGGRPGGFIRRGFGRDLAAGDPANGQFDSAWGNLVTGNFQEWQLGFELDVPIGFRRAHAAVHAAKLALARERSVLYEQERQVIHDLSNSLAEADRAYSVCKTNLNRYRAAKNLVRALEARAQNAKQTVDMLDRLLDAHRRLTDAEGRYFLARTEYEIALKNVYFEKGAIFDYYDLKVMNSLEDDPPAPAPKLTRAGDQAAQNEGESET